MGNNTTKYIACNVVMIFLMVNLLPSCAQQKKLVHNTYAFFEQRFPGKLRVDEKGEPYPIVPDTTIFVYVETTAKPVEWELAWQNGNSYSILKQELVTAPFNAGKLYSEDRPIKLFVEDGNYLWKLHLIKKPNQVKRPAEQVKENEILLKGKYKGKSFYKNAGKLVELQGVPSV